jgi:hypothetical protein
MHLRIPAAATLLLLIAVVPCLGLEETRGETPCGRFLCEPEDRCCPDVVIGSVCYSPLTDHCAFNRTLCGLSASACGTECFNIDQATCFGNNVTCGRGSRLCGSICYDPRFYDCVSSQLQARTNLNPQCGSDVCPTGFKCCNSTLTGPECYDPRTETCCQTPNSDNILTGICGLSATGVYRQCCNIGGCFACYDPNLVACPISKICPLA